MIRVICAVVAVTMLPFALTSYNGASLLGAAATTIFIALTISGTPSKENQS